MRIYPKNAKELIDGVLNTSPHRKANYCAECDELVEEPMMICRDDIKRRGPEKIFVDDRATKKFAKMLQMVMEELRIIATGHERNDDHVTAAYSNKMRLKAARLGATIALENLDKMAEEE